MNGVTTNFRNRSGMSPDTDSVAALPGVFQSNEAFALQMDAADPLAGYRDLFHLPTRPDGQPLIYFCGNSLGLQPKAVRADVERELDDWARLGVCGHFRGQTPWYS